MYIQSEVIFKTIELNIRNLFTGEAVNADIKNVLKFIKNAAAVAADNTITFINI